MLYSEVTALIKEKHSLIKGLLGKDEGFKDTFFVGFVVGTTLKSYHSRLTRRASGSLLVVVTRWSRSAAFRRQQLRYSATSP